MEIKKGIGVSPGVVIATAVVLDAEDLVVPRRHVDAAELPKEVRRLSDAIAQAVVDLAYNSDGSATALVVAARAAGCEVIVDGYEALVRQGAASFERWTGVPAPVDVMRAAVRP